MGDCQQIEEAPILRRALAVAALGMVAGLVWQWPDEDTAAPATSSAAQAHSARATAKPQVAVEVQRLLAQGGCPGWMVLAAEPEVLSREVHEAVHDDAVAPASFRDDEADLLGEADDLLLDRSDLLDRTAESPPAEAGLPSGGGAADDGGASELLGEAEDLLLDRSDALDRPVQQPTAGEVGAGDVNDLLNDRDDLLAPGAVPREALPAPQQAPGTSIPPARPLEPVPEANSGNGGRQPSAPTREQCALSADQQYPSAETCRTCHEKIYEEWSVSGHAYAAISPMFHRFEQTIHKLTHGTIGYFCYRCHSPVGTALCIPRDVPLWDAPQVAREGVTCVACHRVNEQYGKTNGERRIVPGDVYDPVYGSIGGSGVAQAIAEKNKFKVKTSPHEKGPGQPIHRAGLCFPQLHKSEFCTSCHQVAVHPGIKLEVVWEQYRASPACKKGISCQDCHMGRIPGVPSGYEAGPAAVVNKKAVHPRRKHANHVFYGPGYSIAHPGIFPWNPDAKRWTMPEWLEFDWRADWGTDAFEDAVEAGQIHVAFPKTWDNVDDRYDAREIIEANQKKLAHKRHLRLQVFENSSHVDGPFFKDQPSVGRNLRLHYQIVNSNEGHNLPTASLGAQPQFWANVVLIGPCGQRLWESGYTDRYGDLADIHSEDVRHKRIPYDWQLFNLQTMFLITGAKGTDREFPLPVNVDIDQLPFIRPGVQPIPTINHPPFIRMEGRSLAPLGSRRIPYKIPAAVLKQPGRYRLSFRMRNRAEPIYFMRFCNSTPEMIRAMNEGILDVHVSSVEFVVR